MNKIENKDICRECGGYCCKKSGCDYFVSDFENMKIDYLNSILQEKRTSIVSALDFKRLSNGKLIVTPILYLRARNVNRSEIDLLSFKTTCASLEEDGCYYDLEHRPSGGASLIPVKNVMCYSNVDRVEELKRWLPYQNVLQRLVKRYTGMSVENKLKQDVENLFYDVLTENFDGIDKVEILDVLSMLPSLVESYPNEYQQACKRAKEGNIMLVKRK